MIWVTITCPNCSKEFVDPNVDSVADGGKFMCPLCFAAITITMTWEMPEEEKAA